jgi:hypothetical protein
MLSRHRLKLLDAPTQRVAAHGFKQLGRGVHGGDSITRNITCQASRPRPWTCSTP